MKKIIFGLAILTFLIASCKTDEKKPKETPKSAPKAAVKIPVVSADSAFAFIEKQLSFGYRVPGTPEHVACKDWFVAKMKSYGANVLVQEFKADFMKVKQAQGFNIMSQFNPKKKNRVLLAAHWDSRIIAEKDEDTAKQDLPIYGADDGASGVAALIEIARIISENEIDLGVDIIFFDIEDQGDGSITQSWALGSQHWSKNKVPANYTANFGILLDMVGAKGAMFGKEVYSNTFAGDIQEKVWKLAQRMGNSSLFVNQKVQGIYDDHVPVNQDAKIKMIDIINYDLGAGKFGHYHHTHKDDISIIDRNVLRKVAQVVTAVIYKESEGSF